MMKYSTIDIVNVVVEYISVVRVFKHTTILRVRFKTYVHITKGYLNSYRCVKLFDYFGFAYTTFKVGITNLFYGLQNEVALSYGLSALIEKCSPLYQ